MAQTIFTDKQYIEFDKYQRFVMKNWKKFDMDEQEKHRENWKRGREKMEQLAQSYGIELKTPYPKFARMQELAEIQWISSKVGDEKLVWGLWDGEDHVKVKKDGKSKHVFSKTYLDFMTDGIKNAEVANQKIAELIVLFDGAELKRGVNPR